jgi:hypothetical protein
MSPHDLVDAEPSKGTTAPREEDGRIRIVSCAFMLQELRQVISRTHPEGTLPPLVSLSVKLDLRPSAQFEMANANLSYLLGAGTRVV